MPLDRPVVKIRPGNPTRVFNATHLNMILFADVIWLPTGIVVQPNIGVD